MNRTILILICDFLLVSLLAFSTVDINKTATDGTPVEPKMDLSMTNQPESGRDLAAAMKLALDDEQKQRELLLAELEKSRASVDEKDKRMSDIEQRLAVTTQQKQNLQQQFAEAQTNITALSKQVHASSTDANISKEKLAAMEAQLRQRAEEAAAMQRQISLLSQSNQTVLSEKQQLTTQLKVAEVEKQHATEQVVAMTEQVKAEREEKARLAEGIKSLATNSTQLVQEIRDNRPLTSNTIFDQFNSNRIEASFTAFKSGLLDTNKRNEAGTVLVTDGTNTYAMCHVEDTPLTFWAPGVQWESLTGNLTRDENTVPVHSLSFHFRDPRIVFVPVNAADAKTLGGKPYRMSDAPYKFQDAVLVGANEGYYGECKFEIDVNTPAYVKLDRNLVKGLFGKFNPSRGDLVFSRTGELLGIMANHTYCLVVHDFDAATTVNFGPDVREQRTGDTLAALYNIVLQMPSRLQ